MASDPNAEAPDADEEAAEEQERARRREAARKRRKRRLRLQEDAEREEEEEEEAAARRVGTEPGGAAPVGRDTWRLVGPHFLLGVERVTNVLSWNQQVKTQAERFNNNTGNVITTEVQRETSGTDVAFLGSGATGNVFSLPRLTFDGMFRNGLTLGGALMYVSTTGKVEYTGDGAGNTSLDTGTAAIFILAPRVGVMLEASSTIGVWLRGGITRTSVATDVPRTDDTTGATSSSVSTTATLVDLTLDPQLVISPVPHVGITVGLALDIGAGGSFKDTSGEEHDMKSSSYGVSGGLLALF